MLSFNIKNFVRVAAVVGLTVGLSACFRPLYGPTASGESMQAVLASIDVPENQLPDELAQAEHFLRSELIYQLNGSGVPAPKKYKLAIAYSQGLSSPIVDSISGRALSTTLTGTVNYTLSNLDGSQVVTTGKAISSATYDRFEQRFASVRANRDAQIRVTKDLAQQIRTQIAAAIATKR